MVSRKMLIKKQFNVATRKEKLHNKQYLAWLKGWTMEHQYDLPVEPYETQAKDIKFQVGFMDMHYEVVNFGNTMMSYETAQSRIQAFAERVHIRKLLFEQMKKLSDPKIILWKQHVYLTLVRSRNFSLTSPANLLYDTADLQWIEDSTEYVRRRFDDMFVEDAKLSLYSHVGQYVHHHDTTVEEVLQDMPTSWFIAAVWDGSADEDVMLSH